MNSDLPDLERKLLDFTATRGLFAPGSRVLVAVSGGPDSMALVFALSRLSERLQIRVEACHLNHHLREQAAEDAVFVAGKMSELDVPVVMSGADVAGISQSLKLSLEEAARRARYDFFARAARSRHANKVATGHTADDQLETFLMRLARGSGLDGLASIPPRRPLGEDAPGTEVVRPLLDVTREEVLAYCSSQGIEFRIDETNESPAFVRNRIRAQVIPALDDAAPGWRGPARRTIDLLVEDASYLAEAAEAAASAMVSVEAGEGEAGKPGEGAPRQGREAPPRRKVVIDLGRFEALPPAIKARVLRSAHGTLLATRTHEPAPLETAAPSFPAAPSPSIPAAERIDAVLRRLQSPGSFRIELGVGVEAVREYDRLILQEAQIGGGGQESEGFTATVDLPGGLDLPGGAVLQAEVMDAARVDLPSASPAEAFLDLDRLSPPLVVRGAQPGDRFRPSGMTGTKKLHDFFVDSKTPPSERRRALVVESRGNIVWLVGHRVSAAANVTPSTRRVVKLTVHARGEQRTI